MSHTQPQTHIDSIEPYRCYVTFYYNGKRQRIYNGKLINQPCNPNLQKSLKDRKQELARLCQLINQALKDGWFPGKLPEVPADAAPTPTLVETVQTLVKRFDRNGWSRTYQRDMSRISNEFVAYLSAGHPLATVEQITAVHLTAFLDNYRSSGRYYMNKRRNLSALYKQIGADVNPVLSTPTMKVTEHLNEAYKPEELVPILNVLKQTSRNLYLCALMTYGTLLRPHEEIRLLRRRDFDNALDFITLAGKSTKNGRIRKVPVPEYVKHELLARGVRDLPLNANIFTGAIEPFNHDYFTTCWSRIKVVLLEKGLLNKEQTLYSFRHSAAIYSFTATQNLKLLQSLMGHGSPDVSLKYLRSLGVIDAASPDDLPKLPLF